MSPHLHKLAAVRTSLVYRSPDQYLWRTLFLDYPFDDPRLSNGSSEVDWCAKLRRRVRAEQIARRDGDRRKLVDVLLECVREAAPWATYQSSHNLSWVTAVLTVKESPWIEECLRLGLPDSPSMKYSASGAEKLRAHLALSLDRGADTEAPERLGVLRRMSRARVYDLRNYTREAHWGPFTDGGDCVNWGHVNAFVTVQGLEACRAYSAPGALQRSPFDWAGVEGQWLRIVCFCDYRYTSGRNPGFFDDEHQEASRLLRLDLRIITVESDPRVLEKLPDPSRPPITFGGTMRVRGTVCVMKDGNIRWSFSFELITSSSSEGVQIGGVCSAAGVVGAGRILLPSLSSASWTYLHCCQATPQVHSGSSRRGMISQRGVGASRCLPRINYHGLTYETRELGSCVRDVDIHTHTARPFRKCRGVNKPVNVLFGIQNRP
ncbi:hypothetical protein H4582DRAFT_1915769 [Lactarius indigo]|nr:hypothetical protein H4582DRAFT_1915769 [Lactarius indigo]